MTPPHQEKVIRMSTSHPHRSTTRHAQPRLRTPAATKETAAQPLRLAPSMRTLATSPTLDINEAIATRRAAGRNIIHLGFGEATMPLHPRLREALEAGAAHTSYAPVLGIQPLREAIAGYLTRERGLDASADRLIIAPGSKPLLYTLLQSLEGDLLLPVPSWVSYAPHARLAGRKVIPVATDPTDFHRLTPKALAAAHTRARHDGADPRILIVNTPSNPTGGMLAREDVEAMTKWARGAGVTIISDEIYAELAHGWRSHTSPAISYPEGTIITGGLSKGFAAGGWRLGYALLPGGRDGAALLSALRALASEIWSSASTPIQEAATLAFLPDDDLRVHIQRSARLYGYATARLHARLTALGVLCPRPAGGFYLYADFAPWRTSLAARGVTTGQELARHLLDEWDVATLPGIAFGDAPDALRLRLATSLLFRTEGASTPEQREAAQWSLIARADALDGADSHAVEPPLLLPMLAHAEQRFAEFVDALGAADAADAV